MSVLKVAKNMSYVFLKRYGKACVLRHFISLNVFNPSTGDTTNVTSDANVNILMSTKERFNFGYFIDENNERKMLLSAMLAAKDLLYAPVEGDQIIMDGSTFIIVQTMPEYVEQGIAFYKIFLRKV